MKWIPPNRVSLSLEEAAFEDEPKPFHLRWPSMDLPIEPGTEGWNVIVIAGAERR